MTKSPTPATKDYSYSGAFDPEKFSTAYAEEFKKVPKYNDPSVPDLMFVLRKIGSDANIKDIR